jgi:hypothetical protein
MAIVGRPQLVSTVQLIDTTQTALVVGAAAGSSTGTGGANLGTITLNSAVGAPSVTASTLYQQSNVLKWATVPVNTGSGTTGQIPKFTTGASGILGDSLYSEANITTIKAGGIGIASQTALDFIYAGSSTQLARLAAGTALQAPRINAAGNAWEFAPIGGMQWLQTTTGTSTAAGSTSLGAITFSGVKALTTTDSVLVVWNYRSTTQPTANVRVRVDEFAGAALTAVVASALDGVYYGGSVLLQKACDSDTVIVDQAYATTVDTAVTTASNGTGWPGPWSCALRHDGVTAGGTLTYRISFYRIAGQ